MSRQQIAPHRPWTSQPCVDLFSFPLVRFGLVSYISLASRPWAGPSACWAGINLADRLQLRVISLA